MRYRADPTQRSSGVTPRGAVPHPPRFVVQSVDNPTSQHGLGKPRGEELVAGLAGVALWIAGLLKQPRYDESDAQAKELAAEVVR